MRQSSPPPPFEEGAGRRRPFLVVRFMRIPSIMKSCIGTIDRRPVVFSLSSFGGEGRGEEAPFHIPAFSTQDSFELSIQS
jgi:hypothetical protein